jgi:CheY-like chemotaxis protein
VAALFEVAVGAAFGPVGPSSKNDVDRFMNSDCRELELIGQPPSPKVLIAEDEVLLRLMLSDVLRDHGHQVFEAANASEALSVLQTTSDIAVVISDMHMKSKEDGMVLASFVRQNHPHALLLLASAHEPSPSASEGAPPFDAFFRKPYRPEQIVEWIGRKIRPQSK